MELEEAKYCDLDEVKYDVECELKHQLPGCEVLMFGSCWSKVAFKNSDVDLFIQCGELSDSLYIFPKDSFVINKSLVGHLL